MLIGEVGAELDGSGRGIHLIIQRGQHSGFDLLLVRPVERIHFEPVAAAQLRLNLRQIVFRNVEHHGDRLQLRDDDQRGATS